MTATTITLLLVQSLFVLSSTTQAWVVPSLPLRQKRHSPLFSKKYDLGLGKNRPKGRANDDEANEQHHQQHAAAAPLNATSASAHWIAPTPVEKPPQAVIPPRPGDHPTHYSVVQRQKGKPIRTKKLVSRTEETRRLRGAVWDEEHFQASAKERDNGDFIQEEDGVVSDLTVSVPSLLYPDIDLSIPESIYSNDTDAVWELLRYEAFREAQREPLLVSFLYSTILNHGSLESALAFHLANRLSSPAMISTQIQALILEALANSAEFRQSLRADAMAVRDRDPACTCLPDAFLYFKGFQALQTHRVAHYLYRSGRQVLAHYLQSQSSQIFQIGKCDFPSVACGK